ncbi:protein phosphatase [Desulfofundulus australicus DSM 11792]|jgi:protein phosphatase|uniref:Protein phosphatase n=1 Tax=Desulfofundulus australicus DSM 11792 TaxID=1121425 RepID=A0A1M4U2Z0_9FIRM|nr:MULTISPECIES: Stp1/IreP family PP2C-type Ser/Thr phosphatase [Desulfofundulus]SHE50996.1 protein phosphatase [Desulfofundulus australicus DSM 11792]
MKWSQASDAGLVRQVNEDSMCVEPGLGLFAVADGMGGHQAGEIASRTAINELVRFLKAHYPFPRDPGSLLLQGIQEANRLVYQLSFSNPGYRGMGTTLTAALVKNEYLYLAHVGDSRVYLLRKGKMHQLTEDHSLVGELVRLGGISEEQARNHPRRNILTRALGIEPRVEVDGARVKIQKGDKIILCTDGLTVHLSPQDILMLLQENPDPDRAVSKLIQAALNRGGSDNITVILLAVD